MQSMEIPDATPLHIETLDGGSPIGGASVGLMIELPPERRAVVLAQTSVKVVQRAGATSVRYGDMIGGPREGLISENTVALTFSPAVCYPNCVREIPGSTRFCPECGTRQCVSQPQ